MIYSQVIATLVSDAIIYVVLCLIRRNLANIIPGLICIVLQVIFINIWCTYAHKWYFNTFPPLKTIIIYDEKKELKSLINEYGLSKKFDVQKTMKASTCLKDFQFSNWNVENLLRQSKKPI